jgi:hypothetical protein
VFVGGVRVAHLFSFFYVVCIYALSSDVRYDFRIKPMIGSSLPPVVCKRLMSYLGYLALFAHSGVQHILCCILVCFSSSDVPYVSLDCPFLIAPLVFSNVYLQCYLSQHHALILSHTNAIICIFFERNMKCL